MYDLSYAFDDSQDLQVMANQEMMEEDMWLFAEFLPELIGILKKTKEKANNPIMFYLFLIFLGIAYLFLLTEMSYESGLILITVFFLIVLCYRFLDKKLNTQNNPATPPILVNAVLRSYSKVIPIKYNNIWSPTKLVCNLSNDTKMYINFGKLGKEMTITVQAQVIKTKILSHLRIIFLGYTFQKHLIDTNKTQWMINIRLWGIFTPRLIITIKPKN